MREIGSVAEVQRVVARDDPAFFGQREFETRVIVAARNGFARRALMHDGGMHLTATQGGERCVVRGGQPQHTQFARTQRGVSRKQAGREIAAGDKDSGQRRLRGFDREMIGVETMGDRLAVDNRADRAFGGSRDREELLDRQVEGAGQRHEPAQPPAASGLFRWPDGLAGGAGGVGQGLLRETPGFTGRLERASNDR